MGLGEGGTGGLGGGGVEEARWPYLASHQRPASFPVIFCTTLQNSVVIVFLIHYAFLCFLCW